MMIKRVCALFLALQSVAHGSDIASTKITPPLTIKTDESVLAQLQTKVLSNYGQAIRLSGDLASAQFMQTRRIIESQVTALDTQLSLQIETSTKAVSHKREQLNNWLSLVENDLAGQRKSNQVLKRNTFLVGAERSEIRANLETYTCDGTLILLPGDYLARLKPGQRVWVAIESNATSTVQLSTVGSDVDTRLEVYSDHCPTAAQLPERINDDDLGLSARFEIAPQRAKRTYLALTADQAGIAQINVVLVNGQINGQISLASNISDASININVGRIENNYFQTVGNGYLTGGGAYSISVPPGVYYVVTSGYSDSPFLGQIYPNIPCAARYYSYNTTNCPFSLALAIAVQDAQTVSAINFNLTEGAVISGRINGYVGQNSSNVFARQLQPYVDTFNGRIDSVGRYRIAGLPPGTYKSYTSIEGYRDQIFDGINCTENSNCDFSLGTDISLTANETRSNINFTPQRLPTVSGKITLLGTAAEYYNTYISFYNSNGFYINTYANSLGNYRATVSPGTYYLSFSADLNVSQLYQNKACTTLTQGDNLCQNYLSGTPIIVSYGDDLSINATLAAKGGLTGVVKDDVGAPIEQAIVRACSVNNPNFCNGNYGTYTVRTDAQGLYSIPGMTSGQYYVLATSNKHLDRAFPNVDCQILPNQNCNVQLAGAQPVSIADSAETSGINFSLIRSSGIKGKVYSQGLPNYYYSPIDIYKAGYLLGAYASSTNYSSDGQYEISDLANGEYRMIVGGQYGYNYNFQQIYANRNCGYSAAFPCNVTTGDAVLLSTSQTAINRDFSLEGKYVISGVVNILNAVPVQGVIVDMWQVRMTPQTPLRMASTTTDSAGRYMLNTQNTAASYYIATDAGSNYRNQIYSGVICAPTTSAYIGNCGFPGATALTVPAVSPGQLSNVNFTLAVSAAFDQLFSSGFEARE
jgi:hypothetical protein